MTAPAPRRDRPPPRTGPTEREVLTGFLDYLRDSALAKVEGIAERDLRTPGVPSGTRPLGLIAHLARVERFVFLGEHPGDWQATFHAAPDRSAQDVLRDYREAVAAADLAIAACGDLGRPVRPGGPGKPAPSLRWSLAHMIEETGRHAGHLDILCELIDGRTGR
ncbi:Protein of unknown function [Nocardiopsis flavescens]|uniref:Mini-circle protein n=1 Tax=Nocardiopsis flavescens TaxID=758803 RepID=A0A1M6LC32_9ACTN|nr:DinB family protein [Nocardiopsis flavescens]SHJ68728.1 Protein of unknown function [Nocardiopsis flavescens]